MPLFGPNLLFFCFIVASAKGEVVLEVIKNENGSEASILSAMETRKGANFLLECRVIDLESRNKLSDQIVWEKFVEVHGSKILESTIVGATVPFIPVSAKSQGQYVCLSAKYKLRKIISLRVRPESSSEDFKETMHSQYFNGRIRKRSNGSVGGSANENSKASLHLNKFTTIIDEKKTPDDHESNHWDVKKIKLDEENETLSNSVRYHDGTTDTFRIGLVISFVLLAIIGIYRLLKCWRKGTLGPLNNRARATSVTSHTLNNYPETCDSNQTTITTCALQNENVSTAAGLHHSVNRQNPIWEDFMSNNCVMDDFTEQPQTSNSDSAQFLNNDQAWGQTKRQHAHMGNSSYNNSHNLFPVANLQNDSNTSNNGFDEPPPNETVVALQPSTTIHTPANKFP